MALTAEDRLLALMQDALVVENALRAENARLRTRIELALVYLRTDASALDPVVLRDLLVGPPRETLPATPETR